MVPEQTNLNVANTMDALSPAQLWGYLVFVLGVVAFAQKRDTWLKGLLTAEASCYVVHFLLLGRYAASGSAFIAGLRTLISIRYRSRNLVVVFLCASLGFGSLLAHTWTDWLPVASSCVATFAVFLLSGMWMRLLLLVSTMIMIANNIICGSIGGTLVELCIGTMNITTTLHLLKQRNRPTTHTHA